MKDRTNIIIIAEIGINHNGDINLAKKMINEAKNCGAGLVKFQKRDINLVYDKKTPDAHRESPWGKTNRDQKKVLNSPKRVRSIGQILQKRKNWMVCFSLG